MKESKWAYKQKIFCETAIYPRQRDNPNHVDKKIYTCSEVRQKKDQWLLDFRNENNSDSLKVDRYYENYKKELEDFLTNCTCEIKCGKLYFYGS